MPLTRFLFIRVLVANVLLVVLFPKIKKILKKNYKKTSNSSYPILGLMLE
jgi:hypothetical protein